MDSNDHQNVQQVLIGPGFVLGPGGPQKGNPSVQRRTYYNSLYAS